MFAVIKTGGKQYIVEPGQKLKIEKISPDSSGNFEFKEVLLVSSDKDLKIGTPLVAGASVSGRVLKQGKAKKVTTLKYHSKNRYHIEKGHRQPFTEVEIQKIDI